MILEQGSHVGSMCKIPPDKYLASPEELGEEPFNHAHSDKGLPARFDKVSFTMSSKVASALHGPHIRRAKTNIERLRHEHKNVVSILTV